MWQLCDARYEDGYANGYNERNMRFMHIRCQAVVGYGPNGMVIKENDCYRIFKTQGGSLPVMIPAVFMSKKSELRKQGYLTWLCR